MDEKKIYTLNTGIEEEKETGAKARPESFSLRFQTNPILKEMLFCNIFNKKGKFKFKDLFR